MNIELSDAAVEYYAALSARIAEARRGAGMRQDELGAAVGLTRSSITNIEAGVQRPAIHTAIAAAQALGVSPTDLILGGDIPHLALNTQALHTAKLRAKRDRLAAALAATETELMEATA